MKQKHLFHYLLMAFLFALSSSKAQETIDSLRAIQPDTLSSFYLNWEAKLFLNNNKTVKGIMVRMKREIIEMQSGEQIPVSEIVRIRLYRHTFGKVMVASSGIGFFCGYLYGLATGPSGNAIVVGFIGLIPGAAAGLVISPLILPFTKYRFKIDGNEENVRKMIRKVHRGKGKNW